MFILLKPNLQPKLKFPISVKIESIYTLNEKADKTPPCLHPLLIFHFFEKTIIIKNWSSAISEDIFQQLNNKR